MKASFERRAQEWKQQLSLSRQDVVIGNQQITLAKDHVLIAQQELHIAAIQVEHALETISFLANKFTNAELFDWMSRVLERVYAFFLQQATAIARLAGDSACLRAPRSPANLHPVRLLASTW